MAPSSVTQPSSSHASGSRPQSTHSHSAHPHAHAAQRKRTSASESSAGRDGRGERDDAKMIGQWRIGRTIGKGSSGRVKIAKHAITGKYAAIKIVPKGAIISSRLSVSDAGAKADKVLLGIEREIVIMKLIDHPNVLSLYDVWETSTELYLIMEYVPGGELFDYLVRRGRLPVSEALHYFQQIIYAVDYCHRFNICHRDLKPENLLLDKDKNIKVADFGMAAWEAGERLLETSCGSPHYASPEIVAGKAYHGSSSDIWSCGIILFALLTGRLPFDDDNIRSLLQKVKIGVFEMPDEIKDPARDLLRRMLEKDPERRITMPEILNHPFFTSRPPRQIPGRALVSPPSLDEVENPVSSRDDIDPDIMGNLKTLWQGASDDEIVAALMGREKTWEKAIYHLLVKYRNKHLENYNMDDEEDSDSRAKRHTRRRAPEHAKRKGTAPSSHHRNSAQQQRAVVAPLGDTERIQDQPSSPPISRPSAPTPKKASGVTYDSPAPTTRAVGGGKLDAPVPTSRPAGPRPPLSPRIGSTSDSSEAPGTPSIAISVQEATPVKDGVASVPMVLGSSNHSASPSRPDVSPTILDGSQLPQINVPQVQDAQLQSFFNDIATQLNTMNIRSSVASGSSTNSAITSPEFQAYMAYIGTQSNGTPVSTPLIGHATLAPAPVSVQLNAANRNIDVDPNQFADADEDDTEAMSVCSSSIEPCARVLPASPILSQGGHPTQLIGLGLGSATGLQPVANNRWSVASSSVGSSSVYRGAPGNSHPPDSPALYSQNHNFHPQLQSNENGFFSGATTGHTSNSVPIAHRPAPAPPHRATRPAPPRPVSSSSRVPVPSTYGHGSRTVTSSGGESLLPRENSYVVIDTADMHESDPALASWSSKQSSFSAHRTDAFGKLKKKKIVTINPVPYSSTLDRGPTTASSMLSTPSTGSMGGGPSTSSSSGQISPKRSWFNNLFSFKPASMDLVSVENVGETREKAKKILKELGVSVVVAEVDGLRALKCKIEDSRELQTGNVLKGVRFRVEFARGSPNLSSGGYLTLVSSTLEKGAQSSFKEIITKLKLAFENDLRAPTGTTVNPSTPRSPRSGQEHVSPSFATPMTATAASVGYTPNSATYTTYSQRQQIQQGSLTAPIMRYTASAPNSPIPQSIARFVPAAPGSVQLPSAIRM